MRKSKAKKLLEKELKSTPIVSFACKKIGVSRQSYYRWCREDSDFKDEMETSIEEGINHINDMSENQIIRLIQQSNFPAIKFWLTNNHSRYSDSLRHQIKEKKEREVKINHLKKIHDKFKMPDPSFEIDLDGLL